MKMKRERGSEKDRRVSKETIVAQAREGVYDGNPLLTAPHEVTCKDCGHAHQVTYLEHLKNGRFELGETQAIEVSLAAPTITGLGRATEMMTPVIFRIRCQKCGAEIVFSPVNLEYLLFMAKQYQQTGHMYV
jgi:hypothetical protein